MTTKFKLGDMVKVIRDIYNPEYNGRIGFITSVSGEGRRYEINHDYIENFDCGDILELVEEEKYEPRYNQSTNDLIKSNESARQIRQLYFTTITRINKQTIMSKITTFAKNLVLSADEKLLRKLGLKDECGEYTDDYKRLANDKFYKDSEEYVLTIAKGMEAEEAKK